MPGRRRRRGAGSGTEVARSGHGVLHDDLAGARLDERGAEGGVDELAQPHRGARPAGDPQVLGRRLGRGGRRVVAPAERGDLDRHGSAPGLAIVTMWSANPDAAAVPAGAVPGRAGGGGPGRDRGERRGLQHRRRCHRSVGHHAVDLALPVDGDARDDHAADAETDGDERGDPVRGALPAPAGAPAGRRRCRGRPGVAHRFPSGRSRRRATSSARTARTQMAAWKPDMRSPGRASGTTAWRRRRSAPRRGSPSRSPPRRRPPRRPPRAATATISRPTTTPSCRRRGSPCTG